MEREKNSRIVHAITRHIFFNRCTHNEKRTREESRQRKIVCTPEACKRKIREILFYAAVTVAGVRENLQLKNYIY